MRTHLWLIRRYALALGALALAFGLAYTANGEWIVGLPLVLVGFVAFVFPVIAVIRQLRRAGFDGDRLGWQRSAAADDPANRRRLNALGTWLVTLAAAPAVGAVALLAVVYPAAHSLDVAATVGVAALLIVLALAPAALAYQLLRAGMLVRRGYADALRGASRLVVIVIAAGAVTTAMAASDREHRLSDEFLLAAVPVVVIGGCTLAAIALVNRGVDAFRAAQTTHTTGMRS